MLTWLGKFGRSLAWQVLRVVNAPAGWTETLSFRRADLPRCCPPIFLVGAPRCGSTLVYQAMLDAFDFGYLCNLQNTLFGAPILVEAVFRPGARRPSGDYASRYGRTSGWAAPSEAGRFWYRFLPRDPAAARLRDVSPADRSRLRSVVGALSRVAGRPILFKNLANSVRIEPLVDALPEARWIIIRRDVIEVARSLLKGRMDTFGSYANWFSIKPPGAERWGDLPPEAQVVEQVRGVYAEIDRVRRAAASDRFHDISYRAFCENPREVIEGVGAFLAPAGVRPPEPDVLPASFPRPAPAPLDPAMEERMLAYAGRAD